MAGRLLDGDEGIFWPANREKEIILPSTALFWALSSFFPEIPVILQP
jgi:hypothetical protein